MKVDKWEESDLRLDIVAGLGGREFLGSIVVRVHICLVMLAVVELHDLARDGRLKSTIVI